MQILSASVRLLLLASLLLLTRTSMAQESYRRPPEVIARMLDAPLSPSISVDPQHRFLLLIERTSLPPLEDLAQPMLRLAGKRINPATNGRHEPRRYTGLVLQALTDGGERRVELPEDANVGYPSWSPDGTRFAFTITTATGIELWVGDTGTAQARRLTEHHLNGVLGSPFRWHPDGQSILCWSVVAGRGLAPVAPLVPSGPVTQETHERKAPVRTYQDLLRDAHEEALFEYYAASRLVRVELASGTSRNLGPPALYSRSSWSPDGKHLLVSYLHRPISYLVPASSFPEVVEIWDAIGRKVHDLARLPLRDAVPLGGVPTGPRGIQWQSTATAALIWAEALDGGDPKAEVPHRDRLLRLSAPFEGEPREMVKLEHRWWGVTWPARPGLALFSEYDRDRRWTRSWLVNLKDSVASPRLVFDRSIQDRYGDPGRPVMTTTPRGKRVALMHGESIYLAGSGASPEGDRPFLDRLDLSTLASERLWRCEGERYESVLELLEPDASKVLTMHETQSEPANVHLRNLAKGTSRPLTVFPDPTPELRGLHKELIHYERDDGVALSGTLYLPPDYQEGQRLPLLVWAYPREFNDARTAGQVRGSPYRFTRVSGSSHLFLLTQGYAILDGAAMPVIGDPETMNDTFLDQVVSSARAAIEVLDQRGVVDPERVGVGGHSYGAFMTANLLAHSDLFRAGVARSGAYNRTLTPFGFQSERRTLWEAPMTYFQISPFMHAHKINEPLLLIHGQRDNNSGTFPIQSERLYHALKGHGATARLVMLPFESHGYRARESVLHVLAEMVDWFDAYVKSGEPAAKGTR